MTGPKIDGEYLNLDGGFDSRRNREAIFNAGLIPNINENPRNRKTPSSVDGSGYLTRPSIRYSYA